MDHVCGCCKGKNTCTDTIYCSVMLDEKRQGGARGSKSKRVKRY